MKRLLLLFSLTLACSSASWALDLGWLFPDPPSTPTYSAPEPAALIEVALIGLGLGVTAWRRAKQAR